MIASKPVVLDKPPAGQPAEEQLLLLDCTRSVTGSNTLANDRRAHGEAGACLAQEDGEQVALAGGAAECVAAVAVALLVEVAPAGAEARPQCTALGAATATGPGSSVLGSGHCLVP